MAKSTKYMVLTGGLSGKSIILNGYRFVNGICKVIAEANDIGGIFTYFERSYQVKILDSLEEKSSEIKVEPEKEQVKPNNRQQAIIAAVNKIDKKDWVDLESFPRPKVKDVAKEMNDPTVTKDEIIQVITKWLS